VLQIADSYIDACIERALALLDLIATQLGKRDFRLQD
jgi:hypothetical protein